MTTNPTTTPTDWFQHLYQPNLTSPPPSSGGRVSDSTVVSATLSINNGTPPPPDITTSSYIAFSELGLAVSGPGSGPASTARQLSPPRGGRVSKPTRRRQRASKKTPTTLLNADTANFRSMVQRYTGGPSAYDPPPGLIIGQGQHHQGQIGNFGQHGTSTSFRFGLGMHYPNNPSSSTSFVDHLQGNNLHHQIRQQHGGGLSSTARLNPVSSLSTAVNRPPAMNMEEEIEFFSQNHHLGPAGGNSDHSSSLGGGENKRSGFMF